MDSDCDSSEHSEGADLRLRFSLRFLLVAATAIALSDKGHFLLVSDHVLKRSSCECLALKPTAPKVYGL